jgi:hypothetical protein
MGFEASDEASGGRQMEVSIVEVAAERGHCRFNLKLARCN